MKTVIMAGGRGTRIASLNAEVPKPMIRIDGKPIFEYQMECLKKHNLTDIILVIGHLGNIIEEFFGNSGQYGVYITYVREDVPLGTAGALYYMKDIITDDFLLINGDIIFDVDFSLFLAAHRRNHSLATIFTHPNSHPYDSGIIVADKDRFVTKWLTKEEERKWYKNRVNAGMHILSPTILKRFEIPEKKDLDRDILKPLIAERQLSVYDSPEYVKDMGTPDRYYSVEQDIKSGLTAKRNLSVKQKAIFLDRDGTVNKYVGFLKSIDDLVLLDGVSEAIKMINKSGYLAIIITNQPVIARGEVSWEELTEIHNKMETLLGNEGAYIDDIFCCPHHPDRGYAGERTVYKKVCDCRKPKPGLILQAAKKYNIDLHESWMVGDSFSDMEAGRNAGCNIAYVGTENVKDILAASNLLECIRKIFEKVEIK